MDSVQTISKAKLYSDGPITVIDGDWVYTIELMNRLDDKTPIEDKRIGISVFYKGNRDIKRAPINQPIIRIPDTIEYEISYSGLFMFCSKLVNIEPLRQWDVSNVTDMRFMFAGCTSLNNLEPIREWNIERVKRLDGMFMSCHKLNNLTPLSNWNLSSCIDSSVMFLHCHSLTTLNGLEHWTMPCNVTTSCMFASCHRLSDISAVHEWKVSHIPCMIAMFEECNIEDVSPLENWLIDAPEVNISRLLSGNIHISGISSLSRWKLHINTEFKDIFNGCYHLRIDRLILQWMPNNPSWLTGYAIDAPLNEFNEWLAKRALRRAKYDPCKLCTIMLKTSG